MCKTFNVILNIEFTSGRVIVSTGLNAEVLNILSFIVYKLFNPVPSTLIKHVKTD